jgi:hypothetical protein
VNSTIFFSKMARRRNSSWIPSHIKLSMLVPAGTADLLPSLSLCVRSNKWPFLRVPGTNLGYAIFSKIVLKYGRCISIAPSGTPSPHRSYMDWDSMAHSSHKTGP